MSPHPTAIWIDPDERLGLSRVTTRSCSCGPPRPSSSFSDSTPTRTSGTCTLLEPRIAGIETVEPPTDGPIVAYARRDFGIPGRLLGTDRALRAAAR